MPLQFSAVLVLAGISLIFFLADDMVLCFGFWMKIKLITHQYFSHCRAVLIPIKDSLGGAAGCCPTSKEAGGAPGAGRDPGRTAGPD